MISGRNGTRSAVVIGAGIGGLTAAVALHRIGWDVTVLERSPVITEVGAGLTLWPNAIRTLGVLGLEATVSAHAIPTVSRGNIRQPDGRWLRHGRPDDVGVLAIHRAQLHEVLRGALPQRSVRTGADVVEVTDHEHGATTAYIASGEPHELTADLVVAADGLNSASRQRLFPDHPAPVFQHRTVWRGVTEPDAAWPVQECITLGRGEQVGLLPLTDHRVYWFLTVNAERPGLRSDDEHAEARRRIAHWHEPIPSVVDATRPERVLHNDIVDLDPLPAFVRRHTALLGDAAHAMTPDLGQGACQAIEDAVVLADHLAGEAAVPAALAAYDRHRRARTQLIARTARQSNARNADDSAVAHALTALAVRLVPPGLWRRSTARWADWTPPTAISAIGSR
ncbi:FAD-dependent monooxygenase [Pseudonocardia sp. CA-142604]|uniref:FAD-dependent monooxygenase n=1 Tax=Pseudonocardia sp. CA-142604 TaxID=3240024 RepID=UPI003D91C0BF